MKKTREVAYILPLSRRKLHPANPKVKKPQKVMSTMSQQKAKVTVVTLIINTPRVVRQARGKKTKMKKNGKSHDPRLTEIKKVTCEGVSHKLCKKFVSDFDPLLSQYNAFKYYAQIQNIGISHLSYLLLHIRRTDQKS
jgi:hypothetical protein